MVSFAIPLTPQMSTRPINTAQVPARTGSWPAPGSFPIAAHESNGVPPWRPRATDRPQSAPSTRR